MCLPDFIKFDNISEFSPLIGYRTWRNTKYSLILTSRYQEYSWEKIEGPHEITEENSGIYAYNNNNYNNYNNYYNYNNNNYNNYYNYYNNYYNYNYNYYLGGIINQWGKVAIHKGGQRSEFAKISKLFTISKSNARGPQKFLGWIDIFNKHIEEISVQYECETITWQDFKDSQTKSEVK